MRYLLVLGIFCLGVFAACQQASTQTMNQAKNSKASPSATATPEEAKRISLKDAKAAFDAGKAQFVDTRPEAAYKAEHIKGSINMPAAETADRIAELSRDKQIIFYCS